MKLDVVTAERVVYSGEVDAVVAPGKEGQLGILPNHAPLMTILQPGELLARKGGEEISLAIAGGFLEVRPDHIVVLADAAERADEIDIARAETAKQRAEEALAAHPGAAEAARIEAALRRSLVRLKVQEKRKRGKL